MLVDLCLFEFNKVVHALYATFTRVRLVENIGLYSWSSCLTAQERQRLARAGWRLAWASIGSLTLTHMHYTCVPPLSLLGLLDSDDERNNAVLPRQENMWRELET